MGNLELKKIKVQDATPEFKRQMFLLFEKYYKNARYESFLNDLNEKGHILTLWNRHKGKRALAGFSTIMRKTFFSPEPHVCIYSGDTVIDKHFWGTKDLQRSFFWYILETKLRALNKPVYWFLISKGHKTYLMMRKNFLCSFPNRHQEIPKEIKAVMDRFYSNKFERFYSRETNLIRFDTIKDATREEYLNIEADIYKDPDAAYFLKANPEFQNGVELACIAELHWMEFYHHFKKYYLKRCP